MSHLLTPYVLAREVYFVLNCYRTIPFHVGKRIKPLRYESGWLIGRVRNKRFKIPATAEALSMRLDDYSYAYILPMLVKKKVVVW